MKILFLDIDGVVNKWFKPGPLFIPEKVAMVNRIKCETRCNIVLSSTWRKYPRSFDQVEGHFDIWSQTPEKGKTRGEEIFNWFSDNCNRLETTRSAILDDDFSAGDCISRLVDNIKHFQPDSCEGITEEMTQQIINYLNS